MKYRAGASQGRIRCNRRRGVVDAGLSDDVRRRPQRWRIRVREEFGDELFLENVGLYALPIGALRDVRFVGEAR